MTDFIYLTISLGMMLAFPAVWRLAKRRRPEWSRACANWRSLGLIPAVVALTALAGLLAGHWRARMVDGDLRNAIQQEAASIARTIDPIAIRQLSFTAADRNHPVYRRLSAGMRLHSAAIGRRSIYSIAVRGSQVYFGPEGIPEGDALSSPPGTIYQKPAPGLIQAFRQGISYTEGPYKDEYGTFVSAFAPVKDRHNGETVLLVGVDLTADRWSTEVWKAQLEVQGFTLLLMAVGMAGLGLMTFRSCVKANSRAVLRHAEVFLVAAMGVLLSLGAAWSVYEQLSRFEKALFDQLAVARFEDVFEAARACARDQLESLALYIENQPELDAAHFESFAGPLVAAGAAQAWEWAPVARPSDIEQLQSRTQRELGIPYQVFERDGHGGRAPLQSRPDYFPVLYAAPLEGNLAAVGYDLGSEPVRRAAIEESIRSGLPAVTSPLYLVQGDRRELGMLAVYPVYEKHPASGSTKRELRGFALAALRLRSLLANTQLAARGAAYDFSLFSLRQGRPPLKIAPAAGSADPEGSWVEPALGESRRVIVAPVFLFNQAFEIAIDRGPEPLTRSSNLFALLAAVCGVTMSLAAAVFVAILSYRRAALETEVETRTRELVESNTQLAGAASEARRLRTQSEAASRSKSEFLANLSHEIRTSMNGMVAMSGLLVETPLSNEQRQFANAVHRGAESLLSLIDDATSLSRTEAGVVGSSIAEVDLRGAVEQTVELLAVRAHAKSLELCCSLEDGLPAYIRGDAGRLRQALVNLAGNAVKFTETGGVTIRVSALNSGLGGHLLRFAVEDTGPGIAPEKMKRLFEPFGKPDGSAGVGLSIVRNLVESMGGEMGVEAPQGGGATFWFTAAFEASEKCARPEEPDLSNFRALVLDGFPANREWLARAIAARGGLCAQAAEAEEAVRELAQAARRGEPYHAIFIDARAPGMDGIALCQQIRALPELAATHCALMASLDQPILAAGAPGAGVDAILVKPLRSASFAEVASQLLAPQGGSEDAAGMTDGANPRSGARAGLRVLIVDDNVTNQEVAARILEAMGANVRVANSGRAGLDALRNHRHDLVLMDCQMPNMDGFETTRRIRDGEAGEQNQSIVIVALTASAMVGDRELCLEAGMNDYLSKPLILSSLRAMLKLWFGAAPAQTQGALPKAEKAEMPAPGPAGPPDGGEPPSLQRDILLSRVMGKKAFARRVLNAFLDDAPTQIAALSNAINGADAPGVRLHAHSIKGAASAIGGDVFAGAARAIEELGAKGQVPGAAALMPRLLAEYERIRQDAESFRDSLPVK